MDFAFDFSQDCIWICILFIFLSMAFKGLFTRARLRYSVASGGAGSISFSSYDQMSKCIVIEASQNILSPEAEHGTEYRQNISFQEYGFFCFCLGFF